MRAAVLELLLSFLAHAPPPPAAAAAGAGAADAAPSIGAVLEGQARPPAPLPRPSRAPPAPLPRPSRPPRPPRLALKVQREAQIDTLVPPPVLSGHAASLTPY